MKIYPSIMNFGPLGLNRADFNGSCWRWVVSTMGVKKEIDEAYAKLGTIWEEACTASLTTLGNVEIEREVPFKAELEGGVIISGRADIVGPDFIVECKAHYSRARYNSAPHEDHIAQLVTYMMEFEKPKGMLMVAYYEEAEDSTDLVQDGFKTFTVTIAEDDNTILIDGNNYKFTLNDLADGYAALSRHLIAGTLPEVPQGLACFTCPAKEICGSVSEKSLTESQLRDSIREVAENLPFKAAKIKKRKTARKGSK